MRLRQQIYSAFASVAQRPCCAFGERLPTSCRRQIGQIERRRAGAAFSAKKIMRSSEICARIIALLHYRIMRYAQNAMAEKMQASVRQRRQPLIMRCCLNHILTENKLPSLLRAVNKAVFALTEISKSGAYFS